MAKANPHWRLFESSAESLAIFSGPHSYISPNWYVNHPAVPTWNYSAVHVYGVPRLVSHERTSEIVDELVAKYEGSRAAPWPNDLPAAYRNGLIQGIVGFEVPIARIEGKFKLGQNRSVEDQKEMVAKLRTDGDDARQLAEFIDRQLARSLDPTSCGRTKP